MSMELSIKKQSCCVAVLPDLQAAGLACLELHVGNLMDLSISVLNKPEADLVSGDCFRIKSVGTITCCGNVAGILKQNSLAHGDALWEMTELLGLIGVPTHHGDIYGHALKSGLVVLMLQGHGKALRQGCQILESKALGKPVLYLT